MTKAKKDTAKIDEKLLERVKNIIKTDSKKIKYSNTKQFINVAVLKLLEEEESEK